MKVYLAAPYAARDLLRDYVLNLADLGLGVSCCSSWLIESYDIHVGTTGAALALEDAVVDGHVEQDLADVAAADVLVVFTAGALGLGPASVASGGRHVETGYALALGKPVLVVGEPENVFHRSSRVQLVRDWPAAVGLLGAMAIAKERHREYYAEKFCCPVCAELGVAR